MTAPSHAQTYSAFLSRTSPRPSFEPPEAEDYNIRFTKAINARFRSSLQAEYNDNINLSSKGQLDDFYVIPNARLGFVWRFNDTHILQFNLGGGYEYHFNQPALNTLTIDPNTRLEHRMGIGNVQLTFSDAFSIQADPTARGEISGGGQLLNFRRFHDDAGVQASWQARNNMSLVAGYNLGLDQSLSGQFQSLDHKDHDFNAGVTYALSPRSIVGLSADYIITEYDRHIQNDGVRTTIGPNWVWNLSQFITLNASVGYSTANFDHTGTLSDTSNFGGLSYQASVRHRLNRRITQQVQVMKYTALGFNSNFTEVTAEQYTLNTQLGPYLYFNSSFSYEQLSLSGVGGERADRVLAFVGLGLHVTRHWTAGLGYAMAFKTSSVPIRDYTQNRFTLDISRQF